MSRLVPDRSDEVSVGAIQPLGVLRDTLTALVRRACASPWAVALVTGVVACGRRGVTIGKAPREEKRGTIASARAHANGACVRVVLIRVEALSGNRSAARVGRIPADHARWAVSARAARSRSERAIPGAPVRRAWHTAIGRGRRFLHIRGIVPRARGCDRATGERTTAYARCEAKASEVVGSHGVRSIQYRWRGASWQR
jgi:hypothetical protein